MTRQPSESFHDGGTCTVSPNLDRGEDPLPEATCTVSSTEQQTTPSASIIQTATCTADDWESNPKHNTSSQKQHQDETKNTQDDAKRRQFWIWGLGLILLVIIIIVIAIIAGAMGSKNDKKDEDNQETPPPPTTGITDPSSPQARTQQWLDGYPNYASLPKWRRDQLRGLALFYYSFHGDTWPGPKWTSKQTPWLDYSSDDVECIWYSASFAHSNCNHLGQFTSLVLKDLKLANHHQEEEEVTIPTEMVHLLPSLVQIDLSFNDIHMPLAELLPLQVLGNWTSLSALYLGSNALTGSIPSELGLLTALTALGLFTNQLTSTLPTELGQLSLLDRLLLSNNQLSGRLPVEFGVSLTNLEEMTLNTNQLSGSIPTEWGLLSSRMFDWRLFENQLTGEIPSELGLCTQLWWLALNDNQLSSAIPTELGNLSGLQILSLQSNHLISGTIPVELGNATKLAELELSNLPMLTGTIPPDLWTQLSSLNLEGSVGVTGTIPTSSCERVRFDCSNALCGCDCPCSAA